MRVQLLHNQDTRNSFFDGYKDGDPLVSVYDGEPKDFIPYREDLIVGLDFIYTMNQNDVGIPWSKEARSLSKGDVIVLGDKAYAIEGVGYRELEGIPV